MMQGNKEQQMQRVENISCIIPETNELGGLFLGNVFGAQKPEILKEYGIRAVITTSAETNISYEFEDIPFHLAFEGHDKEDYYISQHINDCIHFIEQHRKFTNVYIHCYAGVSRSSAIVCAYLMWKYRWSLTQTLSFVTFKRVVAKPNDGFMKQLYDVETKLGLSKAQSTTARTNAQKILSPNVSRRQQQPPSQIQRPGSSRQVPATIQKPQSPPFQQVPKMQPFAQLNMMSQQKPQSNYQEPPFTQPTNYADYGYPNPALKQNNSYQQKSVYRPTNHSEVPIPKFLNRKSQYQAKPEPRQEQAARKTIYNDYMSPQLKPNSPRNKFPHKMSLGKMNNTGNAFTSPPKLITQASGNRDYETSIYSTNYSKKTSMETMEKSKTASRCLIRPKDLPGYKTGYKNY